MKPLLLLTDSGHGGMFLCADGKLHYTTGNKKLYTHNDGSTAYEGVINRQAEMEVIKLWDLDSRSWCDVSSGNLDLPLDMRVQYANEIYAHYKNEYNCLYLSLHSNASKGTGIEVFTSPGQTKSDIFAEIIIEELEFEFPKFKFRYDLTDGDKDKEANLYVLKKTKMPSVLVEFLFFDNYLDWQFLQSNEIIKRYSYAMYKALRMIEVDEVWL